jgi:AcrR family transcriptional regulator
MAGDKKSFQLGKSVTVTVPEAVTEQMSALLSEALGHKAARGARGRGGGREQAARLSADRIVDVAIEQMRERGYDAVTMRSIAKDLGTGPASLYAHVANRAELDQLVVGRVAGAWQIPDPDPGRWDEQLREALCDLLALYEAHPGVARCSMGMIPLEPGILVSTERMLALLRAGGVADQDAAWFVDLVALYVGAVAVEGDIWRERGSDAVGEYSEEAVGAEVRNIFAALPAEHFPMLTAMAGVLVSGDGQERFEFGLDLLIAGLKARAGRAGADG